MQRGAQISATRPTVLDAHIAYNLFDNPPEPTSSLVEIIADHKSDSADLRGRGGISL